MNTTPKGQMSHEVYLQKIDILYKQFQKAKNKTTPLLNAIPALYVLILVFSFVHINVLIIGLPVAITLSFTIRPQRRLRDCIDTFDVRMKKEIIIPYLRQLLSNCEFHEEEHPFEEIEESRLFKEGILPRNFYSNGYISYENENYTLKISEFNRILNFTSPSSVLFTFDLKKVKLPFTATIRKVNIIIQEGGEDGILMSYHPIFRKPVRPYVDVKGEHFNKRFVMMTPEMHNIDLETAKYLADMANIMRAQLPAESFLFISVHESKLSFYIFNYSINKLGLYANVKKQEYIKFLNLTASIKTHANDLIAYLNHTADEDWTSRPLAEPRKPKISPYEQRRISRENKNTPPRI